MIKMIIYKATNQINGKVYIGQTVNNLKQRKDRHIYDSNSSCGYHLHQAIRRHGADNFRWEVLCCCFTVEGLNEMEVYFIALYDSFKSGYNMTTGGLNCRMSNETKAKIGKAGLGRKHSKATKQKMSKWRIGIKYSEATKQKISEATSGKNNWCYGKHHSKEHKERIRQSNLGKHHSDEAKEKMSATRIKRKLAEGKNNPMYNKCHSVKSKEKMRNARLKYWQKVRSSK